MVQWCLLSHMQNTNPHSLWPWKKAFWEYVVKYLAWETVQDRGGSKTHQLENRNPKLFDIILRDLYRLSVVWGTELRKWSSSIPPILVSYPHQQWELGWNDGATFLECTIRSESLMMAHSARCVGLSTARGQDMCKVGIGDPPSYYWWQKIGDGGSRRVLSSHRDFTIRGGKGIDGLRIEGYGMKQAPQFFFKSKRLYLTNYGQCPLKV